MQDFVDNFPFNDYEFSYSITSNGYLFNNDVFKISCLGDLHEFKRVTQVNSTQLISVDYYNIKMRCDTNLCVLILFSINDIEARLRRRLHRFTTDEMYYFHFNDGKVESYDCRCMNFYDYLVENSYRITKITMCDDTFSNVLIYDSNLSLKEILSNTIEIFYDPSANNVCGLTSYTNLEMLALMYKLVDAGENKLFRLKFVD